MTTQSDPNVQSVYCIIFGSKAILDLLDPDPDLKHLFINIQKRNRFRDFKWLNQSECMNNSSIKINLNPGYSELLTRNVKVWILTLNKMFSKMK